MQALLALLPKAANRWVSRTFSGTLPHTQQAELWNTDRQTDLTLWLLTPYDILSLLWLCSPDHLQCVLRKVIVSQFSATSRNISGVDFYCMNILWIRYVSCNIWHNHSMLIYFALPNEINIIGRPFPVVINLSLHRCPSLPRICYLKSSLRGKIYDFCLDWNPDL